MIESRLNNLLKLMVDVEDFLLHAFSNVSSVA